RADPFQKPDASSGGARSREEARAAAERAAGRSLVETDGRWAGAWVRVLRGEPPWPNPRQGKPRRDEVERLRPRGSKTLALALLGLALEATEEEIKRAFREAALRTHPDRGGDEAAFIEARRAYEVALGAVGKKRRRWRSGR